MNKNLYDKATMSNDSNKLGNSHLDDRVSDSNENLISDSRGNGDL